MRERESSGLLALFPTSPEAVARGVFWRECGCSHQGVMAEEGAHCPAMMLHLLGESQCRTYQPSNASGSGLCKTVTGSLSRWPARCWVSVRGKAVGNAFTASRLQAAALIAPAQRPGGRGAAGGGKGRVNFLLCCRCCQGLLHIFLPRMLWAVYHIAQSSLAASLAPRPRVSNALPPVRMQILSIPVAIFPLQR
jgi:hypothetical protein